MNRILILILLGCCLVASASDDSTALAQPAQLPSSVCLFLACSALVLRALSNLLCTFPHHHFPHWLFQLSTLAAIKKIQGFEWSAVQASMFYHYAIYGVVLAARGDNAAEALDATGRELTSTFVATLFREAIILAIGGVSGWLALAVAILSYFAASHILGPTGHPYWLVFLFCIVSSHFISNS